MRDGRAGHSVGGAPRDTQAQLSRSMLDGRRGDASSPEDRKIPDSSRAGSSTRGQRDGGDDGEEDVLRLPDSLEVEHPSSGIIEQLRKRRSQKHDEALRKMKSDLLHLSQVCEMEVRTVSEQLLSSLREADLRLDILKDRPGQQDVVGLQVLHRLWEEVEEEVKQKMIRISELDQKLSDCERRRSLEIKEVLRKQRHLLELISFLSPPEVHRLVHAEATMLNQSLLANRRSIARLVLLLQEENLQQESLLRLHWQERLDQWRSERVEEVLERLRSFCSSREGEQELILGPRVKQTREDLILRRCDVIYKICTLVPPTCSSALVSDWFEELTAVNQQIDGLHADVLQQLRGFYEDAWRHHLAEVERCQEALSALQLSDQQVRDIVASHLLPLIGCRQRRDEERLAALDVSTDAIAHHVLLVSRSIVEVMRGLALLWETHCHRLERREEEMKQQIQELRQTQQQQVQKKMLALDVLLGALRQESSEETLQMCLQRVEEQQRDVEDSCRRCVSHQWDVLDLLPALLMDELLSYSGSISSFFRLSAAYRPSPAELQRLPALWIRTPRAAETESLQSMSNEPISIQKQTGPAHISSKRLTEAASSLLRLCDSGSSVTFISTGGVVYIGPAFSCPAPDLPASAPHEAQLSPFPVDLLVHTLTRTRVLVLDHVEQSFRDFLGSAAAMMTERKETIRLEQELQLKPEHIQTHVYKTRLAELQLHQQRVDRHSQDTADILTSCRKELQDLQTAVQTDNQELFDALTSRRAELQDLQTSLQTDNQDGLQVALCSSRRLEALGSALQTCLDQHAEDTRRRQDGFRRAVQARLEDARRKTAELLKSFRLFSEGGDFAPQEVKMFQRRLKEETKRIGATEESIYSELEMFESRSLQQVRKASASLEEKISCLQAEVKFIEQVQKILSSSQIQIKAEAASSNQQQSKLSGRLDDLRRMTMKSIQASPDQICSFFSSTNEQIKKRCCYLDFNLHTAVRQSLAFRTKVQTGSLHPSRTAADLHEEPGVRFNLLQDPGSENQQRGRTSGGPSSAHHQQRSPASASTLSMRRSSRSVRTEISTDIRTKRKFQIFGPKPEAGMSPRSLSASLTFILWETNNVLLQVAEEFYCSKRLCSFNLLPESADQWTESMQQRLLGYQEQGRWFLRASRDEVVKQLWLFRELLHSLPELLISNLEAQQRAWLTEDVGVVRRRLGETLAASEDEKSANVRRLRLSLAEDELQTLSSREELRQQRLHSATISSHLELQECVRGRAGGFVTLLSSLTETLLRLMDELLTSAVSTDSDLVEPAEAVTMETALETGSDVSRGSRTWPGITHLFQPTNDPEASSVTMTTAPITTARTSLEHEAVIVQRDAAMKKFEQLVRSESSCSDADRQNQLTQQKNWNSHWKQQLVALRRTRTTQR